MCQKCGLILVLGGGGGGRLLLDDSVLDQTYWGKNRKTQIWNSRRVYYCTVHINIVQKYILFFIKIGINNNIQYDG